MNFVNYFRSLVLRGDGRSIKAKKNILGSFTLKILDSLVDFALVPLSLAFLSQPIYGLWLTIISLVSWLNYFDVGISHGVRNKVAKAIADGDIDLVRKYISTGYLMIFLISLGIILLGSILIPFVDWNSLFNTELKSDQQLKTVLFIISTSFGIILTLKIITAIFLAVQQPFLVTLSNSLSKFLILILISAIIFIDAESDELISFALIYSLSPILILLLLTFFFYNTRYKSYAPAIRLIDKGVTSDIMGLGITFFVIQLGAAVLFLSDNFIIVQLFNPAEVVPYQVTNKYFAICLVIFTIIISPFWSATTDAYHKKEYDWIKKTIRKLHIVWGILFFLVLIMLALFDPVLKIWTSGEVQVSLLLSAQFALFVILQSLNNIYTLFLNGVGILRIQMLTGIITIFINIPLSILFAKYFGLGTAGVIMATNCCILIYIFFRSIQYRKIISNTATGVWAK
ncbi:hypothetical protein BST97_07045 [Nonlabens spongiae]|uniref:Polysaccharide biosynthesis protein n=1 Tax=Nonlabens spongiae TaxID=331648 RepID=A0A1W6MJI3_9FLAO|nr:MATE family efflux transporter [Nonlabens spongiae]ARN77774.1 hypothetical protein BST97_07045 [Nonlabens spongiae]